MFQVAKFFSYTWSMGFFLCKGVHYLQNVSAICSVLTLTAMSIERYVVEILLIIPCILYFIACDLILSTAEFIRFT
jgi:hypothetical protein